MKTGISPHDQALGNAKRLPRRRAPENKKFDEQTDENRNFSA
jgi:hypothetical protein